MVHAGVLSNCTVGTICPYRTNSTRTRKFEYPPRVSHVRVGAVGPLGLGCGQNLLGYPRLVRRKDYVLVRIASRDL